MGTMRRVQLAMAVCLAAMGQILAVAAAMADDDQPRWRVMPIRSHAEFQAGVIGGEAEQHPHGNTAQVSTFEESPAGSSWQKAWDSEDLTAIESWYQQNTGLTNPSALSSGPVTSTHNGQVIEDLDITASSGIAVHIQHNNVTIRNCRVTFEGVNNGVVIASGTKGTLIEHCELIGTILEHSDFGAIAVVARAPATIRRNEMKGYRVGVHLYSGDSLAEENYLVRNHDGSTSWKGSGIGYRGSSGFGTVVQRNFINYTATRSSGSTNYASHGPIREYTVRENIIIGHGRGFGMYGGYSHDYKTQNRDIVIEGNRFAGEFGFPDVLGEGTNAAVNISQTGNTFDQNRWLGSSTDLPARCGIRQNACE